MWTCVKFLSLLSVHEQGECRSKVALAKKLLALRMHTFRGKKVSVAMLWGSIFRLLPRNNARPVSEECTSFYVHHDVYDDADGGGKWTTFCSRL